MAKKKRKKDRIVYVVDDHFELPQKYINMAPEELDRLIAEEKAKDRNAEAQKLSKMRGDTIYEKGIKQGIEQGGMEMLFSLVKEGLLNLSDASRKANISEPEFIQLMEREQ